MHRQFWAPVRVDAADGALCRGLAILPKVARCPSAGLRTNCGHC